MKKTVIIASLLATILFSACDQRDTIDVYETSSPPDLSNPIVQKLTNVTWYKNIGIENTTVWTTTKFKEKASSPFESMLYMMAWMGMELRRDGSSTLLFQPPLGEKSYIFCQGKWKVSTTEKNTIVVDTKTPVGYINMKLKVKDLQAKDNVSILTALIDVGDRVLMIDFYNNTSIYGDNPQKEFPGIGKSTSQDWFSTMPVSHNPLSLANYVNTSWETISYKTENKDEAEDDAQLSLRSLFVEDLLTKTPAFFYGLKLSLGKDNKAFIQVPKLMKDALMKNWNDLYEDNYPIVNATWRINGSKIIVETDEMPHLGMGEVLFNLITDKSQAVFVPSKTPEKGIYLWRHFYYILELVKNTSKGAWFRVTSEQETHYVFMLKTSMPDVSKFVGVKNAVSKLN